MIKLYKNSIWSRELRKNLITHLDKKVLINAIYSKEKKKIQGDPDSKKFTRLQSRVDQMPLLMHKFAKKSIILSLKCLLMRGGLGIRAETLFFNILANLKRLGLNPWETLDKAFQNCRPVLELRSKRVGGAIYQIPRFITVQREISLAVRWIIKSAFKRREKNILEKLVEEFRDAASKRGMSYLKREDLHEKVLASRPLMKHVKKIK